MRTLANCSGHELPSIDAAKEIDMNDRIRMLERRQWIGMAVFALLLVTVLLGMSDDEVQDQITAKRIQVVGIAWLPLNAGLGTTPVVSLTVADGTLLAGTVASGVWAFEPFDIDADCNVGISDFLLLLANWS